MAIDESGESNKESAFFNDIKNRVEEVRGRIDEAAKRSGRSGSDVLLVAVSKYAEPLDGVVEGFLRAGVFDLAENRPQRLLEKTDVWDKSAFYGASSHAFLSALERQNKPSEEELRWHFIGSLQRNKVRRVLPFVSLLHSVDSWKLLEAIERILTEEEENAALNPSIIDTMIVPFPRKLSVLLEARISEDVTKHGFAPDEIVEVLPRAEDLKHVEVRGLMGMAGLTASPDETRRQFAALRKTLENCRERYPEFTGLTELSMGMSGDFEAAIEEGATIVRVGSTLYPAGR